VVVALVAIVVLILSAVLYFTVIREDSNGVDVDVTVPTSEPAG
jgi:hypothetical protein